MSNLRTDLLIKKSVLEMPHDYDGFLEEYLVWIDESIKEDSESFRICEDYINELNAVYNENTLKKDLCPTKVVNYFMENVYPDYYEAIINKIKLTLKYVKRYRRDLLTPRAVALSNKLIKKYEEKVKQIEDAFDEKFESGYFNKE